MYLIRLGTYNAIWVNPFSWSACSVSCSLRRLLTSYASASFLFYSSYFFAEASTKRSGTGGCRAARGRGVPRWAGSRCRRRRRPKTLSAASMCSSSASTALCTRGYSRLPASRLDRDRRSVLSPQAPELPSCSDRFYFNLCTRVPLAIHSPPLSPPAHFGVTGATKIHTWSRCLPTYRSVGSRMDRASIAPRARADGGAADAPPPGDDQGVVPPRATSRTDGAATSTAPRRGARTTPTSAGRDRRRRAQLADRQPADRGQPAVLLPHDRARARRRRAVGCLVEAVDRRGGAPLDGDLRLPDGDPGRRPGRARAGPDAPGVDRAGARAATRRSTCSSTSPCRSWPPASPTATPGGCSATAPATTS